MRLQFILSGQALSIMKFWGTTETFYYTFFKCTAKN